MECVGVPRDNYAPIILIFIISIIFSPFSAIHFIMHISIVPFYALLRI